MPSYSYTYNLTDGTTADADEVMANFNTIRSLLVTTKLDADNIQNGAITNALISSSAAIDASKLATTTVGHVLLGTTTTGVPTFTALSGDITVTGGGVTAIGNNKITNAMLGDGVVDTAELAAGAVETAKIEDLNVTAGKLAADSVTTAKILDANVTTAKIADSNVTTAKIADANVTTTKLATQTVGYGTSTTTTSITTASTFQDLVSVTATVPSATGRYVKIEGYVPFVTADGNTVAILDLTVDGTRVNVSDTVLAQSSRDDFMYIRRKLLIGTDITAASHTFKLRGTKSAAVGCVFNGAATTPIELDITIE